MQAASRSALVSLVGNVLQERLEFNCAPKSLIQIDYDARVRILPIILAQSGLNALRKGVPIGAATLLFIANTSIEIVLVSRAASKWEVTFGKNIVDELRDRSMKLSHHRSKL